MRALRRRYGRAKASRCPVCKGKLREAHGMRGVYVCADRNCAPKFYVKQPRARHAHARQRIPMPDMSWLHGGLTGSIHERAAAALGWSVADTQSMSLQALREVVRPVNPALAAEIDREVQSGRYIVGARR